MARKIPPLRSLRAFEAAARHLSFTKAAEELFVTQAAVSHQIKSLEEFLGTSLFERRNRRLLLTDAGQYYAPELRTIFERLRVVTEQVKTRGESGPLTVSVVPTFATVWLVPRLSQFNQMFPEIEVRLKASDQAVDFVKEDIDIAIYYDRGDYPGMHSETLLSEKLTPVCAPAMLEGPNALRTPEDLKKQVLLHDGSTEEWRRWLRHAKVRGVDLSHGPVFSHTSMVLQAAIYGQGVAMGHSVLSQIELQSGRLVQPFELQLVSEYSYDLVCPPESASLPKVKSFCRLVD